MNTISHAIIDSNSVVKTIDKISNADINKLKEIQLFVGDLTSTDFGEVIRLCNFLLQVKKTITISATANIDLKGCLILSCATKGNRKILPWITITLKEPDILQTLNSNEKSEMVESICQILSFGTGKSSKKIQSDLIKNIYLPFKKAITYGLVDSEFRPEVNNINQTVTGRVLSNKPIKSPNINSKGTYKKSKRNSTEKQKSVNNPEEQGI